MNSNEKSELELALLRDEVTQLRYDSSHTALINNFTELLYDAENEKEVFSILLFAVPQVMEIAQIRYFHVDQTHANLQERYLLSGESDTQKEITNGLEIPLTFFGGILAESVLQQETITVENGIEDGDELALRFNSNRYMAIPLIAKNLNRKRRADTNTRQNFRTEEEYLQACIRAPEFPVLGVFWIDTSNQPDATIAASISLLTSLFHTAGAVLGELRMVEEIIAVNDRTEKDLQAARDVQLGLLPASLPHSTDLQAAARYITEDQVGGDYYDIFEIAPQKFGIMVADASGHGTPSALIMTMTKILLKTFASVDSSPSQTLEQINAAIVKNAKTNKFITCFYAILDLENSEIRCTSAGHCPQIILNKSTGTATHLESDGLFVGMFPFLNLENHTMHYTPGENRLILYTDGLTESTNNESMMYGVTRLKNSALATTKDSPEEAVKKMLALHSRFIRNHPKDDDLTLMIVDF